MAEPDPVTAKDPFLHREVRKIHRIEPVHLRAGGERKECSAEEHLLPHSAAEEIAAAEYKKAMESLSRAQRKAQAKAEKRAAERARRAAKRAESRSAFGELIRKIVRFLTHNNIVISKEGEEFASIPLLAVLIICSISVGLAVVAVFVSMMFGYEYSFRGESEMNEADRL